MIRFILFILCLVSLIGCKEKEPQMPIECIKTIAAIDNKIAMTEGDGFMNSMANYNLKELKQSIINEFNNNPNNNEELIKTCESLIYAVY